MRQGEGARIHCGLERPTYGRGRILGGPCRIRLRLSAFFVKIWRRHGHPQAMAAHEDPRKGG